MYDVIAGDRGQQGRYITVTKTLEAAKRRARAARECYRGSGWSMVRTPEGVLIISDDTKH